jgi:hypothetical protein
LLFPIVRKNTISEIIIIIIVVNISAVIKLTIRTFDLLNLVSEIDLMSDVFLISRIVPPKRKKATIIIEIDTIVE